jgi:hypothetical protein
MLMLQLARTHSAGRATGVQPSRLWHRCVYSCVLHQSKPQAHSRAVPTRKRGQLSSLSFFSLNLNLAATQEAHDSPANSNN